MRRYYSDDPCRDAERYLDDELKCAQRLPICYGCGEHITSEDAYLVLDYLYCEDCFYDSAVDALKRECRVHTENYAGPYWENT